MSGVIAEQEARTRYERALGVPLTIVRLSVELPTLQARLRGRHADPDLGHHLNWHLDRAGELDEILRTAEVDDYVVQVGDDSARQVAMRVLATAGLPSPGPTTHTAAPSAPCD